MPGRWESEETGEPWSEDPDAPQERDLSHDDDDTATVPCPSCGQPVPDFAERCHHCGDWIVPGSGAPSRRGPLFVIIVLMVLVAFVFWFVL
jgi:hypothetical protein